MADEQPKAPSLFALFAQLGRSIADLVHVLQAGHDSGDAFSGSKQDPPAQHLLAAPEAHSEAAQLLTQQTPGWHIPQPSSLAAPSYAPAMVAFGIVFIALGAVTVWPLSVVGALIFALAIAKWIGELLRG
jgi:hypothetical protein